MQGDHQLQAVDRLTFSQKLAVLTCILAVSLQIIDGTIVNVAIPYMMGNLGVTLDAITWVSSGYLVAQVVVMPIVGYLAWFFGKKRFYLAAILIFALSSLLCALSPNLGVLIFFRVIQGAAGAALMPIALTTILNLFPGERRAFGTAIFGMCVMISPALGPIMGGYLTQYFGWRSIFLINLPIGLFTFLIGLLSLDYGEEKQSTGGKIDYLGLLYLALGVGFLQYALEKGQRLGWFDSLEIVLCFVIASIFIPAFIFRCLSQKEPLLHIELMSKARVIAGCAVMLIVGYLLYGVLFILPVFAEQVWGLDTVQVGWIFFPGAIVAALCMPLIAWLMKWVRYSYITLFGILIITWGILILAGFTDKTNYFSAYFPSILFRVGFSFVFVPALNFTMEGFQGRRGDDVSALINFFRQVGGSISYAIIATFFFLFRNRFQGLLNQDVTLLNHSTRLAQGKISAFFQKALPINVGYAPNDTATLKMLEKMVDLQAYVLTFERIMYITAAIAALAIIPIILFYFTEKKAG